jgi:hypothetical protein
MLSPDQEDGHTRFGENLRGDRTEHEIGEIAVPSRSRYDKVAAALLGHLGNRLCDTPDRIDELRLDALLFEEGTGYDRLTSSSIEGVKCLSQLSAVFS